MKKFFAATIIAIGLTLAPAASQAALLYSTAANQLVYENETFVAEWKMDTQGQPVNTVYLKLAYSTATLEIADVDIGGSSLNIWVQQPVYSNDVGELEMIGGVSGSANSTEMSLMRVTFRPKTPGQARVSMDPSSTVLLGDGRGTAVGLSFAQLGFAVLPAENKLASISSPTHPDQDQWYRGNTARISVQTKPGEQYSYSLSSNAELIPDDAPDDISAELEFPGLADGIYYFKLNSKLGPSNWQEAGVFRIKIDATPPAPFTPALAKDAAVFDGRPFVTFNSYDSISGVAYYEVKAGKFSGWQKTTDSHFSLPGLVLGDTIEVKVVDKAGNEQVSSVQIDRNITGTAFSNWLFWFIILAIIATVGIATKIYIKLLKKYTVK